MSTYGTLTYHATRNTPPTWSIQAQPHVMIRIKRVLPRVQATRTGTVSVSDTLDVARDIAWINDRYPLEMNELTETTLAERVKGWVERRDAVDDILAGRPAGGLLMEPARAARDYQLRFVQMMRATRRMILADEISLGKTFSGLLLLSEPDALPALAVVPTHLPTQWLGELASTWPGLRGHIVTSGTPYDLRDHAGNTPDVLIINYSKLAGWAHTLAGKVRTVLFDEGQELRRGTDTQKGTAAANIVENATYAAVLSASPIYNEGGEIWNILNILDRDRLGSREEFIREWGSSSSNGKVTVRDPAALGTYLRDNGILLRRTRRDVHRELPEPVRIRQEVTADLDAITALAGDALQMARLVLDGTAKHQDRWAAAGDLDWRLRQATGIAKAPYVAEFVRMILESGEDRVVLFGWHRTCYQVWESKLAEFNPVLYTGSESPTQKQASVKAFMEGDSRVLMMSLRAGVGLDGLQKVCSVAVFGELDWSPEVHTQCIDIETEVLTERGFVHHNEICDTDTIAGFNRETGAIHWLPIQNIVKRPLAASEEMYHLTSPGLDIRVTGGHRMVYREWTSNGPTEWKISTADNLAKRSQYWSLPVAGKQATLGVDLTDDEISFLGWWFTDGCWGRASRQVTISQASASEYNSHIVKTLSGCGFAWTVYKPKPSATKYTRNSPMLVYTIPKYRSRTRLGRGWASFEPYLDKNFSSLLDAMSADQLAIFLDAAHMGNGNKQRGQSWTQRSYHIGIPRRTAVERLQSLCIRRGWRANIFTKLSDDRKPYYILHVKADPVRAVGGWGKPNLVEVQVTPGEMVWCVENELGTLVIRRNGKTAIVGNCIGRLARDGQEATVAAYFLVSTEGADPVMDEVLQLKRMQSEPIRDPDAPLLAPVSPSVDRIKLLAQSVIDKSRG